MSGGGWLGQSGQGNLSHRSGSSEKVSCWRCWWLWPSVQLSSARLEGPCALPLCWLLWWLGGASRVCRRRVIPRTQYWCWSLLERLSDCPWSVFADLRLCACRDRVLRRRAAWGCDRQAYGRRDLPISVGPCAWLRWCWGSLPAAEPLYWGLRIHLRLYRTA